MAPAPVKISVIGIGHVGAVAAAGLATAGHDVQALDIDVEKLRAYNDGMDPIYEPGLAELIKPARDAGRLCFRHISEAGDALGDVILVTTGTPTTETGAADLSQIRSAVAGAVESRSPGAVIVMKSTVPPGTGARLSSTVLRDTPFKYVSNPEFLREGQAIHDWFHPDRIVVGSDDEEAVRTVKAMLGSIDAPYVVTDVTSAEMIKYASNAFLGTKISFINEIAALCDKLGGTIDDVSEGISLDPRIGPSFLQAGVGYGGSCFPKDVRALDQLALTNDHNFELLRSVITVNNRQRLLPLHALRGRLGHLAGAKIAVLGLAFKPNTDDVREAPSLDLVRALVDEDAKVSAYDPKALKAASRVLPSSVRMVGDIYECVDEAVAVVLMTQWPEIVDADWELVARRMKLPRLLFDGRNALDPDRIRDCGFEYRGVGRPQPRRRARNR